VSRRVDEERREAAVEARTEAAKERLRLAQQVLVCFVEGLGLKATAERVQLSPHTVWRLRVWLGVQSGRQWKAGGKRTGRLGTRAEVEGVRP